MFQFLPENFKVKPAVRRLRSASVQLLLCFMLVFAQGAVLVHSHDGDLQRQFDCDICLKVNSTDHGIASSYSFVAVASSAVEFSLPQFSAISFTTPSFQARAPPALV